MKFSQTGSNPCYFASSRATTGRLSVRGGEKSRQYIACRTGQHAVCRHACPREREGSNKQSTQHESSGETSTSHDTTSPGTSRVPLPLHRLPLISMFFPAKTMHGKLTTDAGHSIRRHTSRHLTPKLLFPWHVKVKKARTGTQAVDKGNTFARVAHSVKPWLAPWFPL